jgi:hypothetical protein
MCAAGSGKTWGICNDALTVVSEHSERVLITTYTNKGVDTVGVEIEKQNRGIGCNKIVVRSWFQFLMSELIKPYQSFITNINSIKSFDFTDNYGSINFSKKGSASRYISGSAYVKKDYASELAVHLNEASNGLVIQRLEQLYSHIFIDEFQDMTGYDIDLIGLLFESNINIICVGDNKQATYTTHNTTKNKRQSGKNLWDFCEEYNRKGLAVIEESFESRRFNNSICNFANLVYPNQKNITTCMADVTNHDGVFVIKQENAKKYCDCFHPVVLRYDKKTDVGNLDSLNFGQCKGMTFERVLIYTNGPLSKFLCGTPLKSPEKYYVAVTRPKYSIAIAVEKLPTSKIFSPVEIALGNTSVPALSFISE